MDNNFDKYKFPNIFDVNLTPTHNNFHISETVQHTFDQRKHNISHNQTNNSKHQHDQRTEDQVRSDLNFSIQDLLSKISKATSDFEQPPKFSPQSKQQYSHHSFKNSNLSASTQTNSNQQRSDPYIQKYEPFVSINKKRESEPQKDAFSSNDRFRNLEQQKQNTTYQGFGQMKATPKQQIKNQNYSDWNTIIAHDSNMGFSKPQIRSEPIVQWGRNSSRNQQHTQIINHSDSVHQWGRNSSRNQNPNLNSYKQPEIKNQWGRNSSRNQPKNQLSHQIKNIEPTIEWGRNSSRKQQNFSISSQISPKVQVHSNNNFHKNQWKISDLKVQQHENSTKKPFKFQDLHQTQNSGKKQFKFQDLNQYKVPQSTIYQWGRNSSKNHKYTQPINEWKSSQSITQWGRNSSKNQAKVTQQSNEWNNAHTSQSINYSSNSFKNSEKQEIFSQPEIKIKNSPVKKLQPVQYKSSQNSPKRQIHALLSPFQNSGFGKSNDMLQKSQKNKFIVGSIIIQDDIQKQQCQQIPIQDGKKVNSLFDGRKIRQVAASTIMDSPEKMKKVKSHNPFMDIVQANDPIQQSLNQHFHDSQNNIPMIKINKVIQKSQIVTENQGPKLTIQDFHLGRQLGSGKFGDVYQAIHKQTGFLYAIKKIFKSTIMEDNMMEQFTRQLKIHYSLNYPNIIKLFTHFDDEYHIFLVMQYGQGGMLMQKVKNGQKFASVIVQQMLRAVEYLHNKKIAHRDIKPENIVLMFGDTAKMCDFGWSRVFDSDMKKTFCGTLDYVSPQMKDKGEYSLKIDIWSLGVLTFQLLCGYAPFKDEITNWRKKGGNLNKAWNWNILYPPQVSSVAQSFMRNLLKQNPNERANIRFCLNHLFVRKYNQMSFDEQEDKRFKQIANILKDDH